MNECCEWTYDEPSECWDTECDNTFIFNDGTPYINKFSYCPYCGRPLKEAHETRTKNMA